MKLRLALIASIIIAGLGGGVLLYSSSAAPSSTEVKLYLNPSQQSTTQGQTFAQAIRLSKVGNEKVDYVSAQLTFPAQFIQVKSISRSGSAFNNGAGLKVSYSNSSGTLSATGSGNALANPADVLVVTVTFMAKSTGQASLKFSAASQAGALLGNNNVKNALDTMVGSVVNIAAATQPSPTTNGSSDSTNKPFPSGGTTKTKPAVTTPVAQPNSTSTLNQAPQFSDTIVVPTNTTGVVAKNSKAKQGRSWVLWLLVVGLIVGVIGGLAGWLLWPRKNHSSPSGTIEADSKIVVPESAEPEGNMDADIAKIQAAALAKASVGNEPPAVEAATKTDSVPPQRTAVVPETTSPPMPEAVQPVQLRSTAPPARVEVTPPAPVVPAVTQPTAAVTPKSPTNVSVKKSVEPTAPPVSPTQPASSQASDVVPDMFEDGEKRLKNEGL